MALVLHNKEIKGEGRMANDHKNEKCCELII